MGLSKNIVSLILICLVIITAAAYWQTLQNDFVKYDDCDYVTKNAHVRAGLSTDGISWALSTGHAANWHPITWLSLMLDAELYGLAPAGYHLSALILHILNTLLLFILLYRMTGYAGRSAFVGALFAIHPMHVESVAWVAERKDVLSTFFLLLSLLAYHRYTHSPSIKRYLPVMLLFILGLMSKPMLVTLPFVLLLLDFWPLKRAEKMGWGRLILEKAPLFILSGASSIITFIVQRKGGAVGDLDLYPLGVRLANALVSYVEYIIRMFLPIRLSVFYPHPGDTLPLWQVIGSIVFLALITLLVLLQRKRMPYLLWGWLLYLGMLVPVIGIVQVGGQAFADRYTYIPYIGLFVIITWLVPEMLARGKQAALAVMLLLPLMIISYVQVGYWRSAEVLFRHALAVTRNNYIAHNNYGGALLLDGQVEQAALQFRESVRIKPDHVTARANLAMALAEQRKIKEALYHLAVAISINPRIAKGTRKDKPLARLYSNVRLRPDDPDAQFDLGLALVKQKRLKEAGDQFVKVLRIKPNYDEVHLGMARMEDGETLGAVQWFKRAVKIAPKDADAHFRLAHALGKLQRTDEAIRAYRRTIALRPANAEAHYSLALMLYLKGDLAAAKDEIRICSRLGGKPNPQIVRMLSGKTDQ